MIRLRLKKHTSTALYALADWVDNVSLWLQVRVATPISNLADQIEPWHDHNDERAMKENTL